MRANLSEPSERDFEVFYAVEWDGVSLRAAAKEWQISPTRVGQIVGEVRRWFRAAMPTLAEQGEPRLDAVSACHMHAERLNHLYCLAMESWRASKGEVKTRSEKSTCGSVSPGASTTSFGEVRYLALAARLSHMQMVAAEKLAVAVEKYRAAKATTPSTPPEVGCAPDGSQLAADPPAAADGESLKRNTATTYTDDDDEDFTDLESPAAEKTPERAAAGLASAASPPIPLSRKARRKLLAQKLRGGRKSRSP